MHLALKSAMSRIPYTNKVGETIGSIADPAAAYSLRALNGGDPMVARVRRSSDDAEKDFTASDMDSGSVADWVNGKQDTTLPCDVASAAAAYSLRSVNSNYTGSVVRVRRSSDNAEQDFSDVSLIASWVGSGNDGHVTTWYDQSGNENNATQSTASSQPKIVDAGVYLGELNFLSSTTTLSFSDVACGTTYSFFCALPRLDVSNLRIISGGSAPRIDFERESPDLIEVVDNNFGNKKFQTTNLFLDSDSLTSIINASTTFNVFHNGNSSVTNPFTIPNGNTFNTLGGQAAGGVYEVILYNTDQSSNRFKIESNINNHYGLYTNANDGFVTTWYDQSGNDNHATQSTAGNQPKIVESGVLVSGNTGEPAFTGDGADDILSLSSSIDFGAEEFFVSTVVDVDTGGAVIGSDAPNWLLLVATLSIQVRASNTNVIYVISPDSVLTEGESYLISLSRVGNNMTAYVNGVAQTDIKTVVSTDTFSANRFLQRGTNSNPYPDPVSEIIIYNSDQSSNRTAIEANINNHYDIY